MIDGMKLQEAVLKNRKALKALKKAYEALPETVCNCDTIGVCCVSLPEMTVLEALLWMEAISGFPDHEQMSLLNRFVHFYLTGPVYHTGCPFCVEGSCSNYDLRPFACRAYGLWSRKLGKEQTRKNRDAQKALVEMWERFGVPIPEERLLTEMEYCQKVQTRNPVSISDHVLLGVLETVYLLSKPVADLQKSFETAYQSDFSYLVASLLLGQKKAFLGKYAVVKEIVTKGTEDRLNRFLKAVSPEKWPFNLS